jgi:chitinase
MQRNVKIVMLLTEYDLLDWGQNSYGAVNSADTANWQQPLSYYCQDDGIDVIPIAFLNKFFSVGNLPEINLANVSQSIQFTFVFGLQLTCFGDL